VSDSEDEEYQTRRSEERDRSKGYRRRRDRSRSPSSEEDSDDQNLDRFKFFLPYKFLAHDFKDLSKKNFRFGILKRLRSTHHYYQMGAEKIKMDLSRLNLDSQQLSDILDFFILNRMHLLIIEMCLKRNNLTELPDNLRFFIRLIRLDLSNNRLTKFQEIYKMLPKCRYYLKGNPDFVIPKSDNPEIKTLIPRMIIDNHGQNTTGSTSEKELEEI